MNDFVKTYIFEPFRKNWWKGFGLLALWTLAFVALPSISGWFLAMSSLVFTTANISFSYLIPSAFIRLLSIIRTATRYFERLENHKTTLSLQQSLQLKVFQSVARFPYFRKQVNNNASILENSTQGIDQILNHILLWLLPFAALILAIAVYFIFLVVFSRVIAVEFLISSVVLLFFVPQFVFRKNKLLYLQLKSAKEMNQEELIHDFRGRIEISKYNLEGKAILRHEEQRQKIERLESKLQINSFNLQLIAGLGFSYIAAFLFWHSSLHDINAPLAIGVFFGIMAQAELSEMLFAGKSEKNSVENQMRDVESIIDEGSVTAESVVVDSPLDKLQINHLEAIIPETHIHIGPVSLVVNKGDCIALYGETGKGKSTLLNSLFYPEYRGGGSIVWNDDKDLLHLPVPESIYVTQKAYLLTGTLRENFEGYSDEDIEDVLVTVDLSSWRESLPHGLGSWLGENGEILSGGQRKKLLLAQALLKQPQLLIVDEPTAGISTDNAIEIFQNVRSKYPGITIIMATHQREFEHVANKVIRI